MGMHSFDDFDAWGAAINSAHLQLACDGVENRQWTVGRVDLGDISLQVATEGGGNICYGGNAHDGALLFLPLTHVGAHVANGRPLDDDSALAIPCGADFRIHVRRRAHMWCSVALPGHVAVGPAGRPGSSVIACAYGGVPRLKRLVQEICHWLLDRPAGTPAHVAANRRILAAVACLTESQGQRSRPPTGRPRLDRSEIVRRSMAVIEAAPTVPTAAELARDVGVTSRTLLRTFQEEFGVSPKRYLMLRELHAVRRSLRAAVATDDTVADVLVRHGVWEFGRFAARYRQTFGELPSQTLGCGR
jgi:AraC family ethanolamine operon transcriptional activator